MKDTIISTKKTTTAYTVVMIITSIISMLIGLFALAFHSYASKQTNSDSVILLLLFGLFLIGEGIFSFIKNYIGGLTYVDVYPDRFVGKGVQNFNALSFNIKIEEITNVTAEGFWIHIHTNSGKYKVMTNKNTATQIFNYYNELKG